MTTEAIKKFTQLFKQFLDLCLSPDWPEDDTEPEEIVKAVEVAHHVEKAVTKMKSKTNCFDTFLELLCTDQNFSHIFLRNCMNDPPKSMLKKIINSDVPVNLIDVAFDSFKDLYSENRLVETLSDLMVEAASKETLLKNMAIELPPHKLQEMNNQLYLFVILECDSDEFIMDMLKDCSQLMMDAFVICLVKDNIVSLEKDDIKLIKRKIITGFTNVMVCRDTSPQRFWKAFFNVEKDNLVEVCIKYKAIGEMALEALRDSYRQIENNLPVSSSYIQLTECELYAKCNMIFENGTLRSKFINYMIDCGYSESSLQILFT